MCKTILFFTIATSVQDAILIIQRYLQTNVTLSVFHSLIAVASKEIQNAKTQVLNLILHILHVKLFVVTVAIRLFSLIRHWIISSGRWVCIHESVSEFHIVDIAQMCTLDSTMSAQINFVPIALFPPLVLRSIFAHMELFAGSVTCDLSNGAVWCKVRNREVFVRGCLCQLCLWLTF
jgi:hypothetical protein